MAETATPATTVREVADALVRQCEGGFRNEHHWLAWMKKHAHEINALPFPLRKVVLAAHENATHLEFSR